MIPTRNDEHFTPEARHENPLRAIRLSLKLSQRDVADRCCVPQSAISIVESGRAKLSARLLDALVRAGFLARKERQDFANKCASWRDWLERRMGPKVDLANFVEKMPLLDLFELLSLASSRLTHEWKQGLCSAEHPPAWLESPPAKLSPRQRSETRAWYALRICNATEVAQ